MVIPSLQNMNTSMGDGDYLLGKKQWLIPDITKLIHHSTMAKVSWLLNRQATIDKYSVHINNWDIAELDSARKSDRKSLSRIIM